MASGARTILLTGVNAFIGRHVASQLTRDGHTIYAVARGPMQTEISCNVIQVKGDLADPEPFSKLAGIPFDSIVHIAATSPQPGVDTAAMVRDNVVATARLVDWALRAGVPRFIFTSTLSIHGTITVPVVNAATPVVDPDTYGLTKYLCEKLLRDAGSQLASISIRLPGIVGPGAKRIWLSRMVEQLRRNEPVSIFNPDAPFNNVVHVDDLAELIGMLIGRDLPETSAFAIGAANSMEVRAVAELLKKELKSASEIRACAKQSGSFTIDNTEAIAHGYTPKRIEDILACYARDSGERNASIN